jgi:hypothetical protein
MTTRGKVKDGSRIFEDLGAVAQSSSELPLPCLPRSCAEKQRAALSVPNVKSDLVEIAERNGDFSRNYGVRIGAVLYLCSIFAARRYSILAWPSFVLLCALALVRRFGWVTW